MNKKALRFICALFLAGVIAAAGVFWFKGNAPVVETTAEGVFVPPVKTAWLQRIFREYDYDMIHHLKGENKPVPRLFVRSVPKDFNREKYDEVRPALFYEMMLPVVLKANETLAGERERLMRLKREFDETGGLRAASMDELQALVKRYDVKPSDDFGTLFNALSLRVDGVTPTLLLAMAAQDSGFGTSRYAREYNAVFHQRDWNGDGAVPDETQKKGPQYRIKVFDSLYEAVVSRIHYLNTNGYFENYRTARAKYRRSNNPMRGYSIAHLLINFPYKPVEYPDIIKHLIAQYELTPLDFQVLEEFKK